MTTENKNQPTTPQIVADDEVMALYGDIIDLPPHKSIHHRPMSLIDRAAQFAPFAAVSGE